MNEPELAQLAAAQNHTFPRAQVVRLYVNTDRAALFTWLAENGKDLKSNARVDTWGFAGVPDGCGGTHPIYAISLVGELRADDKALNKFDALLTDAERAEIDASWNELADKITTALDTFAAHCPKCESGNVEPLANVPAETNLFVCLDCATTFTHA